MIREMVANGHLLLFLINFVSAYGYLSKGNVLYKAKPGAVKNSKTIRCAAAMTDPSYVGVRVDDSIGACQGLTWDSGITPQGGDGYSYYDKKTTEENYTPPLLIGGSTQWLFPGTFGEGGRLEIIITPTPDSASFAMRILDITSTTYNVYAGPPEALMVSMSANRAGNNVYFKTWHPTTWWVNRGGDSPYPFTEGVPSNISFVAGAANQLKILFDDRVAMSYTNPSNHEDARQIIISMGQGFTLNMNSIKFFGV